MEGILIFLSPIAPRQGSIYVNWYKHLRNSNCEIWIEDWMKIVFIRWHLLGSFHCAESSSLLMSTTPFTVIAVDISKKEGIILLCKTGRSRETKQIPNSKN